MSDELLRAQLQAREADRYAAKMERALEHIRHIAKLAVMAGVGCDETMSVIESFTHVKDDRKA